MLNWRAKSFWEAVVRTKRQANWQLPIDLLLCEKGHQFNDEIFEIVLVVFLKVNYRDTRAMIFVFFGIGIPSKCMIKFHIYGFLLVYKCVKVTVSVPSSPVC